jgi:hypothetical protein
MAQWKETLEPYIKVNERIKTTTIVPTAGEDLIIGATIISDSGPSYPVLITSQREFLNTFASQEITQDYIEGLNKFYKDSSNSSPDKVASTMWLNAYRLASSTNMLIVRATKGADMNYVRPLGTTNDSATYIVRDGQLLKKVNAFSLTIDRLGGNGSRKETGWAISINEIGIIGNLVADDGPVYEYFAADLKELVEYLNSTSKFFSPNYTFLNSSFTKADDGEDIVSVYFEEVYLAEHFIDKTGFGGDDTYDGYGTSSQGYDATGTEVEYGTKADGLAYLLATAGRIAANPSTTTTIIDLNGVEYSGGSNFDLPGYVVNTYNSNSNLKIRIRRFNHDAVILRNTEPTIGKNEKSPYEVITDVIEQIEALNDPTDEVKYSKYLTFTERDFYEVAVIDPSLDSDPLSFCVGNIPGRGDITLTELNNTLRMINLNVESMEALGLSYYRGGTDDNVGDDAGGYWVLYDPSTMPSITPSTDLPTGDIPVIPNFSTIDYSGIRDGSVVIFDGTGATSKTYYGKIKVANSIPSLDTNEGLSTALPTGVNEEDVTNLDLGNYNYANLRSTPSSNSSSLTSGALEFVEDGVNLNLRNLPIMSAGDSIKVKIAGYDYTIVNGKAQRILPIQGGGDDPDAPELDMYVFRTAPQIYQDLSIDTRNTSILDVTPEDLTRSISSITEDEVYTTEGLTDLGNTNLRFQDYLCNMAKNENYFYPISTLYSTNYLAIANYRSRLKQDSYKLYTSAPWDIDSSTVGFEFHACPSVIYWEAVSKNRSMNREFASVFGFSGNGQVQYSNPVTEFTKKQRQLLLSRQVNTAMWNTQSQTWNMNDCYTLTSENHILNEDGNSRLFIRINKAIPTLLRPLIGRKLNNATYADAEVILKYWFERTILTMQYSVSDYKVTISNLEANDDQARRQNKMYVLVECLFARSMKYVIVYSDALDMGMEFTGEIV